MESRVSIQIEIPEDISNELKSLAKQYNLELKDIINELLLNVGYNMINELRNEANYLVKNLIINRKDALRFAIRKLVSMGAAFWVSIKGLDKLLGGIEKRGFYITYTDLVKDHNGIVIGYDASNYSHSIITSVDIQLQHGGDAYLTFEVLIGLKEKFGNKKFFKLVERLRRAIKYYENYIRDLEDELDICSDYATVSINDLTDEDELGFVINIYVGDWHCAPSIVEIEDLALKIVKKARLSYYLQK